MEALRKVLQLVVLIIILTPIWASADHKDLRSITEKSTGRVIAIVNKSNVPDNSNSTFLVSSRRALPQTPGISQDVIDSLPSFGVRDPASVVPKGVLTDSLGYIQTYYDQYHKGIKVFGAGLIETRTPNGRLVSIKGRLLSDLRLATTPKISKELAVNKSIEHARGIDVFRLQRSRSLLNARRGCRRAKVENKRTCKIKKVNQFKRDLSFKTHKSDELLIYNEAFIKSTGEDTSRLVRNILVGTNKGTFAPISFVDADSGEVLKVDTQIREINRKSYDCGDEFGDDACWSNRESVLYPGYTYGRIEGMPVRGPSPHHANFGTPVDVFGSTGVDDNYDFAGHSHNYYLNKFGRDGGNARGGTGSNLNTGDTYDLTRTYANRNGSVGGHICNPGTASFVTTQGNQLIFCAYSSSRDVFGHEYAHVVSHYKNVFSDDTFQSLGYFGETGALNEAQSDLFGEFFEYYLTGSADWINGTGAILKYYRNLADPPSAVGDFPFPDRFHHPNYYCGAVDNGGIHTNNGVLNKAGYLAAVGGTFNGCTIQPIGIEKLEQIMYRALTSYYADSETFNGAYVALRLACADLYSPNDCEELTKALQAVEMDQPGKCSGVPAVTPACAGSQCQLSGSFATI